mgnify:CR=1 FL=1
MEHKTTGVSVVGVVTIVFVILKLVGAISWKWVWVFSPIWLSAAFAAAAGIVVALGYLIVGLLDLIEKE